ncbi:MAG TPA: HAMP domain-containing protein, partial [bacterium]|nr:HAMP domain-containing protein [bacterium]
MRRGEFSARMPKDWKGLAGKIAATFNELAEVKQSLSGEFRRLNREVGREGRIHQRADPSPYQGAWAGMVQSVNELVDDLVRPTTELARVVGAVANGDLSKKVTADVRGEVLELKEKVNTMVDQLRFFTSEVTRVAREVGVEGRLGQQAIAAGAAGTWKELTDNVNQLAANLTIQVRAISEVAMAVTRGDLTRSISLDAHGEMMDLKDTINQMIGNLRVTTQKDADQVWLKTNLARFALMLQGQTNLQAVSAAILSELGNVVGAQHGVFYMASSRDGMDPRLKMLSAFAYQPRPDLATEFALGEGLVGQCARDKRRILVTNPPLGYIRIGSGLGAERPANI